MEKEIGEIWGAEAVTANRYVSELPFKLILLIPLSMQQTFIMFRRILPLCGYF